LDKRSWNLPYQLSIHLLSAGGEEKEKGKACSLEVAPDDPPPGKRVFEVTIPNFKGEKRDLPTPPQKKIIES